MIIHSIDGYSTNWRDDTQWRLESWKNIFNEFFILYLLIFKHDILKLELKMEIYYRFGSYRKFNGTCINMICFKQSDSSINLKKAVMLNTKKELNICVQYDCTDL